MWNTYGDVEVGHRGDGTTGELFYPRSTGWQFLEGMGLWIGGQQRVDGELRPRVMSTYDPFSGESDATWATDVIVEYDDVGEVLKNECSVDGLFHVRQRLYSFDQGPLRSTVLLEVDIGNASSDTMYHVIPALVIDPCIGPRDNPLLSSLNDRHRAMYAADSTLLYMARDHNEDLSGEIAVAMLRTSTRQRAVTAVDGLAFALDQTDEDKYRSLATNAIIVDETPSDVLALMALSSHPTLAPGERLTFYVAVILLKDTERIRIVSGEVITALIEHYRTTCNLLRAKIDLLPTSVREHRQHRTTGDKIAIAPHPVIDSWTITAPYEGVWEVQIINALGQIQYTGTHASHIVRGPALSPGSYSVVLSNGRERYTAALVCR